MTARCCGTCRSFTPVRPGWGACSAGNPTVMPSERVDSWCHLWEGRFEMEAAFDRLRGFEEAAAQLREKAEVHQLADLRELEEAQRIKERVERQLREAGWTPDEFAADMGGDPAGQPSPVKEPDPPRRASLLWRLLAWAGVGR